MEHEQIQEEQAGYFWTVTKKMTKTMPKNFEKQQIFTVFKKQRKRRQRTP